MFKRKAVEAFAETVSRLEAFMTGLTAVEGQGVQQLAI